jgi:hypothetical protein
VDLQNVLSKNVSHESHKNLSNEKLLMGLKSFVKEERKLLTKLLAYLQEVENRNLHLEMAYSSMYLFCTEYLGYTPHEAMARIQAMRLAKSVPQVLQQLESGKISLTVAANVQGHVTRENRAKKATGEARISNETTKRIVESVTNKTVRESEKILFEIFPSHAEFAPDRSKIVSSRTVRLEINLSSETFEMLKMLQNLRGHVVSATSYEEIIQDLCKLGIKKWHPLKRFTDDSTSLIQ